MEKLVFQTEVFPEFRVYLRTAVFGIPDKRMADAGQVRADLMGSACNQVDFQIGIRISVVSQLF